MKVSKIKVISRILFFVIPFYLKSVPVHSANRVKSCKKIKNNEIKNFVHMHPIS
jgi:hypothetical protein